MFLAGIPVHGRFVVVLAKLVEDPELARKLQDAVTRDAIVIRLDDDERAWVLSALLEAPPGLEGVRATLLAEQARRRHGGLAASNAA